MSAWLKDVRSAALGSVVAWIVAFIVATLGAALGYVSGVAWHLVFMEAIALIVLVLLGAAAIRTMWGAPSVVVSRCEWDSSWRHPGGGSSSIETPGQIEVHATLVTRSRPATFASARLRSGEHTTLAGVRHSERTAMGHRRIQMKVGWLLPDARATDVLDLPVSLGPNSALAGWLVFLGIDDLPSIEEIEQQGLFLDILVDGREQSVSLDPKHIDPNRR